MKHTLAVCLAVTLVGSIRAADNDLADQLRSLHADLNKPDSAEAKQLREMVFADQKARMREAAIGENKVWQAVATRADWEKFRDPRLKALRDSLGVWPQVPRDLNVRVTGKIEGDGYRIENVVYQTRPGLWVTANLYLPAEPAKSMPGVILCHSHHSPATQGELQDMGVDWARRGCVVLVPEHVGHGERRQHPFVKADQYPEKFQVGRQDYYFRYNTALQLETVGDSLMGWMVWDLMRGVDVLLSRPGVDKERILIVGAVAGGGDPAGVTAALDPRITAAAPFNFGGVQPDYATPPDAERDFYWFSDGYWETTRCLKWGARDGFAHWVIVSGVAPRKLIYGHEFSWDRERDPAWPRIQKVFGFYEAADSLTAAFGKGSLKGQTPESSHCNNVGAVHRAAMYPALRKWFNVEFSEKEFTQRHTAEELACLTPEVVKEVRPNTLAEVAAGLGAERVRDARRALAPLKPEDAKKWLRRAWSRALGDVEPSQEVKIITAEEEREGDLRAARLALEVEPGVTVPLLLLLPPKAPDPGRHPLVVGFAQGGKQRFLKERAEAIAELLKAGVAVALVDVRGTGETRVGDSRGRRGSATSVSQAEWILGGTMLGSRLRDLRSALRYLRKRPEIDADRVALWGESFAPANPKDRNLDVPLDAEKVPDQAEPLGGLLGLFGALFEDDVKAVATRGGLVSYQSLLQSQFLYLPHDAVVPGALLAGDLADVAAALAPRPLRLEGLVDGLNRLVPADAARAAYRDGGSAVVADGDARPAVAAWLKEKLAARP